MVMWLYTGVTGRTGQCAEHHLAVTFTELAVRSTNQLHPKPFWKNRRKCFWICGRRVDKCPLLHPRLPAQVLLVPLPWGRFGKKLGFYRTSAGAEKRSIRDERPGHTTKPVLPSGVSFQTWSVIKREFTLVKRPFYLGFFQWLTIN